MSTAAIVWIVVAVVVIAAIVVLLVLRGRRRREQSSHRMGLPKLGALSTEGLDKAHATGQTADRPEQRH